MIAASRGSGSREPRRSPTLADVAALAGVSHQTVSRVMNGRPAVKDATREAVLTAIAELGYRRNRAARELATNRSGRIGMITAHLGLYGPRMIALGVEQAGQAAGYEVSVVGLPDSSLESFRAAVNRLLDDAVEALVVAVTRRDAVKTVRTFSDDVPLVVVQAVSHGQALAVGIDQELGAALATQHLLTLGHPNVAHVSGPRDWLEAAHRRAGWIRAHEELGMLPGLEVIGDWSPESGYRAGLRMAADESVTAVFAANDDMALGLLRALHERGRRVPGEISVVGFDDVPHSGYIWPPLTTVTQDLGAVGSRAVDLALRAIAGESSPTVDLVAPVLRVRASTAPLMTPQRW